ncbi:MAG: 6-carboxyhexanoate--CoA ligase [Nitrospirae bacterium GWF2_44_13]|nr:MAG: 6-carboxyhexanoate--CoA ligase [Nitrospirae bacterium GWF2_44_13]OGW65138.1 MAG: 6-carboxyhexanoate--CoA ligase [Nitrospirae bacterium RIFOXYA2_FULL_44_9]HBG93133.1 6-carboxyhexanoate--CoA ligase [Nitrospiraceae bacterium]
MFSIRMRASKSGIHISGAEGICQKSEISKACGEYIKRALTHSRGKPDEIVITIEKIKQKPKTISLLPVVTLKCNSPAEAKKIITQKSESLGISKKAIDNAFVVLNSKKTMRGASLILAKSGKRVEPDRKRGVRVSRMGIKKSTEKNLSEKLSGAKINTTRLMRVKEALMLASKAASWPDVIAEACISDDPDYTTGYIASKELGYLRIPNIKRGKKMHGGRVFFIRETADIAGLISYLERKPAIII